MPVIAVANSQALDGVAAGLALAATHRVLTERTRIALQGCQLGILPSGLALLAALTPSDQQSIAMALALGAVSCNAHDAHRMQLARYVPSADVPDLLADLRCAPADFLDVPLLRRCQPPPGMLANLFLEPAIAETLESVFGAAVGDAAEVVSSLDDQCAIAAKLLNSNSWRTRECAEAVEAVLGEAKRTLDERRSAPAALAATFMVLRACFEAKATRDSSNGSSGSGSGGAKADAEDAEAEVDGSRRSSGDEDGSKSSRGTSGTGASGIGSDGAALGSVECVQQLEQFVTTELAMRADFEEGVRAYAERGAAIAAKGRGALPPASGSSGPRSGALPIAVPQWQPSTLDARAVEIATTIRARLRS